MSGSCREDVSGVAAAVWLVMQRRDFENFHRIVEFLELTHDQSPGLICYRHHARLSAGLRGKIVLHMIEEKRSLMDILEALNVHFPPVCSDDSTAPPRDAAKVKQSKAHFRKLVLRMIRDERFRQNYLATTLQAEYGEKFLEALEKLLWEFLYRLQTALEQEVPRSREQPRLHREDSVRTPVLPISQSNSDRSVTMMQQDRSYLFRTDSSAEEPHNGLPLWGKRRQNRPGPDSAGKGDGSDSDQTIIELEGSQETNLARVPSDPTCSRYASDQSIAAEKGRAKFLDIFGFDCSESSEVKCVEHLSPPNPLQSQEDAGHDVCSELDRGAKNERNSRGGTKVTPPKRHAHEQRNTKSRVSGERSETRGGRLAPGLTSWRFQPQVHLNPLPPDLVRKYIRRPPDCAESDSPPSSACSGLTQSSSSTCSGLVDSSVTPDDYSNDPDYYPGGHV